MYAERPNLLGIVGVLLLGLMLFSSFKQDAALGQTAVSPTPPPPPLAQGGAGAPAPAPAPEPTPAPDPTAFIAPYDDYVLTQGPHGFSYGHMAIDLTAGNGAVIKSPINGVVSQLYVDQYNNTTLVIENDVYQVLMLHGNYSVTVGQQVQIGEPVGAESNHGYTKDAYGQLCAGRDCGYHTHLNVFNKQLGRNVNPLDLIGR